MPGRVVKVLVAIEDQRQSRRSSVDHRSDEDGKPGPGADRWDGSTAILVAEGDNVKTDETVIQLE